MLLRSSLETIFVFLASFSFEYLRVPHELKIKERHYLGEDIPDEEYDEAFNAMMDQFVETVTVENVYNRLVLFNSKTYHGVKTFGNKPRLTLNFFGMGMSGKLPPIMRSR